MEERRFQHFVPSLKDRKDVIEGDEDECLTFWIQIFKRKAVSMEV